MDWSRINNKHEAEICVFRLLASYENCGAAGGWFEAQGLRIDKASSQLRRTGNGCDITGTWPTHENGPKFPTHWSPGWLVTKIFVWGTSISATWSKDGKELMFINIVDTVF
ncbi:hypothetical protein BO068_005068 [Escherichia coli]|nr:hypothetical protein [Escherichia coli]